MIVFHNHHPPIPKFRNTLENSGYSFKLHRNNDRKVLQVLGDFQERLRTAPILRIDSKMGHILEKTGSGDVVSMVFVSVSEVVDGVSEMIPSIWTAKDDEVC